MVPNLTRFWPGQPLHTSIIEMLRTKATWTDVELYKELKRTHKALSLKELNRALMKLEVTGLINVSYLNKTKRSVELA